MHTFSVALYLVLIYQLRNLIFIVMHFLPKIGLETACPIENFNRLSLHHRRRKRLILPTIQCFQGFPVLLRLRHRPIWGAKSETASSMIFISPKHPECETTSHIRVFFFNYSSCSSADLLSLSTTGSASLLLFENSLTCDVTKNCCFNLAGPKLSCLDGCSLFWLLYHFMSSSPALLLAIASSFGKSTKLVSLPEGVLRLYTLAVNEQP